MYSSALEYNLEFEAGSWKVRVLRYLSRHSPRSFALEEPNLTSTVAFRDICVFDPFKTLRHVKRLSMMGHFGGPGGRKLRLDIVLKAQNARIK